MDRSAQVRALLKVADKKHATTINGKSDKGLAWIETIHEEALEKSLAGDWEYTSSAYEGGSGTGARKLIAQDVLEISQLALDKLEDTGDPASIRSSYMHRLVQT